jgi:hypothetical protein
MVLEDISPAEDILLADAGRVAFGDPENMNEEHGCAIEMCERMTDMVTLQHAKYYNDPGLKAKAWLLGAQMRQADGKDTAEYDLAYFFCSSNWDKTKVHLQKGTWKGTKGWDPALIAAIDDLRDLLIDSDQGQESELWDYTLVHGDYHGANILTRTGGDTSGEVVLDFQVLQLAESVSDLGKFLALVLVSARPHPYPWVWMALAPLLLRAVACCACCRLPLLPLAVATTVPQRIVSSRGPVSPCLCTMTRVPLRARCPGFPTHTGTQAAPPSRGEARAQIL